MAERRAGAALAAYRLAGHALRPVVPLLLAYRTAKGKEDPGRRGERYGRASIQRPAGPLVWVHAASVGETNAVLPIIERITATGIAVLLTTVTVTSAGIAAKRLPPGAFHQFSPLDIVPFLERFLDHWRPDLGLFVESELWPATIHRLAHRNVPLVMVNARMSTRSFARWRKLEGALKGLFGGVSLALAQSEGDGERLRRLGMPAVRVTGNIKLDVPPPAADPEAVEAFREQLAGRPAFVAASTHDGEEAAAAVAHRRARESVPDLVTIIAPRHPVRGAAIRDQLASEGFHVALRSRGEPIEAATDLYIADTLGELGIFYRAAPVAFIGGTLVPIGGHNPIEAIRLDAAVLHGPHVHSCADIYAALDAADPAARVADGEALGAALAVLFADREAMHRRAMAAAAAIAPFSGTLERTFDALQPYLATLVEAPEAIWRRGERP